mgnify:CR=1 FL=1
MQELKGVTLSSNRAVLELTIGGLMLSLSALAVAFANIGAGGAGFGGANFSDIFGDVFSDFFGGAGGRGGLQHR